MTDVLIGFYARNGSTEALAKAAGEGAQAPGRVADGQPARRAMG